MNENEALEKSARLAVADMVFEEIKLYAKLVLPLVMERTKSNVNLTSEDVAKDVWSIAEEMVFKGNDCYRRVEKFFNEAERRDDE